MQQWWFQIGWLTSVYLLSGEVATSIGMAGNLKGSNNVTHFSEMISGNQYYDQGILLYMKKSVKLDWFQCSSQNLKKTSPQSVRFHWWIKWLCETANSICEYCATCMPYTIFNDLSNGITLGVLLNSQHKLSSKLR